MIKQSIVNTAKKVIPHGVRISLRKLNWKYHYLVQSSMTSSSEAKVYCPIAKKEFETFVKIGGNKITPSNGARARQRLVWHYLEHETGILKDKVRVLHTAPELSYYKILSNSPNIDYVPGDKMVDGYSNQTGIANIDLTDLKFEEDSFDYLISNHVLEHIPDDRLAMSEIFRVLKRGGKAIITVPIREDSTETYENDSVKTPKDRQKHFGQWDHVRWYGTDIKDRLESVGFKVKMTKYAEKFSKEEFERFGFKNDYIIEAQKHVSS